MLWWCSGIKTPVTLSQKIHKIIEYIVRKKFVNRVPSFQQKDLTGAGEIGGSSQIAFFTKRRFHKNTRSERKNIAI